MQFTPWFSEEEKPTRPGVYETKTVVERNETKVVCGYSFWDGNLWHCAADSADLAEFLNLPYAPWQQKSWRGLLRKEY